MRNPEFDDLRPYYDEEIAPAMRRITESEYFPLLSSFAYPGKDPEEVKTMMRAFTSIAEFQYEVMKAVNDQVSVRSIRSFSYEGLETLSKDKRYLFVSNHRDIMLDATLLQYALYLGGHPTSEITFGSNLMSSPLIVDIGKSNKMFKVIRGGNMKDFYKNSLHLSEYLRHTLLEKQESVWIAQSNGRSKNGIDLTEPGIIKMFYMCRADNPVQALADLHIVPVSISYQWETCDKLKALERYLLSRDGGYIKQPGEDLNSILTGIKQQKGDVHLHFGIPLTEEALAPFAGLPNNAFNKQIALLLDKQVQANYKLSGNNYIAHDLRAGTEEYADRYTAEEKATFLQRYQEMLAYEVADQPSLGRAFLDIYANPVDSKRRHKQQH